MGASQCALFVYCSGGAGNTMHVERFDANPLISASLHPVLGGNVNGPSVIAVPDWLPAPLGRYYMYFAHHQGRSIRLAYADHVTGPWTLYEPGTLRLAETPCYGHIASPDVHVLAQERRIKMYYHGPVLDPEVQRSDALTLQFPYLGGQRTLVAYSADGISFASERGILGPSYFRYFTWRGQGYALAMPGLVYRQTGVRPDAFAQGPQLFGAECRHFAVRVTEAGMLECFFTRAGDMPERILHAAVDLRPPMAQWRVGAVAEVLRPALDYEGATEPLAKSERGAVHVPVRQLRDPCIFQDRGDTFLFYALAGEQGIGGAVITMEQLDDSSIAAPARVQAQSNSP